MPNPFSPDEPDTPPRCNADLPDGRTCDGELGHEGAHWYSTRSDGDDIIVAPCSVCGKMFRSCSCGDWGCNNRYHQRHCTAIRDAFAAAAIPGIRVRVQSPGSGRPLVLYVVQMTHGVLRDREVVRVVDALAESTPTLTEMDFHLVPGASEDMVPEDARVVWA